MKIVKDLVIDGPHGRPISLDMFYRENGKPKPVVIFSHGFQGFKDWGHFELMAKAYAEAGFFFIKFNFSFNGTTIEQPTDFADLKAFGNNNLSKERDDLGTMIDFAASHQSPDIDHDTIYLLGHSRGGGITLLKAAEDTRVKKVVTLASVGEFGYFWTEDILEQWKETGVIYRENTRTKQQMPLHYQYYEDYTTNIHKFNLEQAVKSLNIPALAIHGTKDAIIPYAMAERFHKWNPNVQVKLVQGGDHTLGGKHPWTGDELPVFAKQAVEWAVDFLKD